MSIGRRACLVLLLVSCGPPARESTTVPATRTDDRLARLADEIDTGFQPPLREGAPPWLEAALEVTNPPDPAIIQEIVEWLPREGDWRQEGRSPTERALAVAVLLRATLLLEHARDHAKGDTLLVDFTLAMLYTRLDCPLLARPHDSMTTHLRADLDVLLPPQPGRPPDELWQYVAGVLDRARAAHRSLLAHLLRTADPSDPRFPPLLLMGSWRAPATQTGPTEVALARTALDLLGDAATADDWGDLAIRCYEGLDVVCGDDAHDRALAGAGPRPEGLTKRRLERLASIRPRAHRAVAGRSVKSLDAKLDAARALFELGRVEDAESTYTELLRRHPRDGRAITGAALTAIVRAADPMVAAELLSSAPRPPDHADRQFYELAIEANASWDPPWARAHAIDLEVEHRRLRSDIAALDALGTDSGAVVKYFTERWDEADPGVVDGHEALVRFGDRMLPDASAIRQRFPDSADAYRLLVAGASVSGDVAAIAEALGPKPTPGDAALGHARLSALFDAAVTWDRGELLATVIDETDGDDARLARLHADALAVRGRVDTDAVSWTAAAASYRPLLETFAGVDASVLNALGVALVESGARAEGVEMLESAAAAATEQDGPYRHVPLLNLVALGLRAPETIDLLVPSTDADIQLIAAALAIRGARGPVRKRFARELDAAAARRCAARWGTRPLWGRAGVLIAREPFVRIDYAPSTGLGLEIGVDRKAWILVERGAAALASHGCATPGGRSGSRRRAAG